MLHKTARRRKFGILGLLAFALQICAAEKDGGIVTYPAGKQIGPAQFSHFVHEQAGYSCGKCHEAGSYKMQHSAMNEIRQGKGCGNCHIAAANAPKARAAAIEECGACHIPASDIIIKLNRMDPVKFSHIKHLSIDPEKKSSQQTGFSCLDCHPNPFARISKGPIGMEVPHEEGGCAKCHNGRRLAGKSVFAANTRCLACHRMEEENR
jgi:c(7)-type cytochrome triheme protein